MFGGQKDKKETGSGGRKGNSDISLGDSPSLIGSYEVQTVMTFAKLCYSAFENASAVPCEKCGVEPVFPRCGEWSMF